MTLVVKPFEQLCFQNVIAVGFRQISQRMNENKVEWVVLESRSVQ